MTKQQLMATLAAWAIVAAFVGLLLLMGCGPASTSEPDVRYHCAQRLYSARNGLSAEILFEACVRSYSHTP